MFSFAMLLYELLTGQRPFESSTNTHKIDVAISRGERPSLSECNLEPAFPAMVELMEDCWRHAPSERPAAHEVIGGDVGDVCHPETPDFCILAKSVYCMVLIHLSTSLWTEKPYYIWTLYFRFDERQNNVLKFKTCTYCYIGLKIPKLHFFLHIALDFP